MEKKEYTLIDRKLQTPEMYTLYLTNPEGDVFDFLPGQFIIITKEINIDGENKSFRRSYSIASSPLNKKYIELTIKYQQNGFTSKFFKDEQKVDDKLLLDGPYGKFTFNDKEDQDVVFIAGGAGITPIMSMIRYCIESNIDRKLTLLFSSKNPSEIIYKKDLDKYEEENTNFKTIHTITRLNGQEWEGHIGRIDKKFLEDNISNIKTKVFYICGPLEMVKDITSELLDLSVKKENIRKEAW